MHEVDSLHVIPAPAGQKRISKACGACRQSKVRCDGEKPCGRCHKLQKQCVFFEIPRDPVSERLEGVETEVHHLQQQLDEMRHLVYQQKTPNMPIDQHPSSILQQGERPCCGKSNDSTRSQLEYHNSNLESMNTQEAPDADAESPCVRNLAVMSPHQDSSLNLNYNSPKQVLPRPLKRRRPTFEVREEAVEDFITKGLITLDIAASCFDTFFRGCDRFIPIFDPEYDTFDSIRSRSSILLNAICTIGCMVETRSGGPMAETLHAELKKWINVIIQNQRFNSLESVQAMLVVACYSAERLLILSFATRMALDLGLHQAFEDLTERISMRNKEEAYNAHYADDEGEQLLMRQSRTWFGLLVLEHIFRVDGGKPPGIRLIGNPRRCRFLLGHKSATNLDLRLFSQVELNILRATINDKLGSNTSLDHAATSDFVDEMKIDLDLWFDDWIRIIEGSAIACEERPYLLAALRIQKCWADMMLNCKALRAMGVQNVAAMSSTERMILLTAKSSARRHLRLILVEPEYYLSSLKYAMDFVWAKCAFSFLLLLKLSRLLPEPEEEYQELLDNGNKLVHELNKAGSTSSQNGTGNIYLQILKVSIEKYGRALQESQHPDTGGSAATSPFWELFDAQADLQWFIPEQFVSEWDFPGLNLFYFPTAWQEFFGDFSLAM